tara:strand:+ start:52010 stop:52159 length:150 start_codon:yes stop_codon:yes gene_type:complete
MKITKFIFLHKKSWLTQLFLCQKFAGNFKKKRFLALDYYTFVTLFVRTA